MNVTVTVDCDLIALFVLERESIPGHESGLRPTIPFLELCIQAILLASQLFT